MSRIFRTLHFSCAAADRYSGGSICDFGVLRQLHVEIAFCRPTGACNETAIIKRYKSRETSVEEALIEMYLAGVSVCRVEDITEALWGTRVLPSTVSDLNKKIYAIDA